MFKIVTEQLSEIGIAEDYLIKFATAEPIPDPTRMQPTQDFEMILHGFKRLTPAGVSPLSQYSVTERHLQAIVVALAHMMGGVVNISDAELRQAQLKTVTTFQTPQGGFMVQVTE